ncbi:MAG: hypothetical protein AB1486_10140 [Planctomycetota bacterium]
MRWFHPISETVFGAFLLLTPRVGEAQVQNMTSERLSGFHALIRGGASDYDQVLITIEGLDVLGERLGWAEVPLTTQGADVDGDSIPDIVVNPDGSITVELTALENVSFPFASGRLRPDTCIRTRLNIQSAAVVEDGNTIPVQVSAEVELLTQLTLVGGSMASLTWGFDVARCIVDGGGGGLSFEPFLTLHSSQPTLETTVHVPQAELDATDMSSAGVLAAWDSRRGIVYLIDPASRTIAASVELAPGSAELVFSQNGDALVVTHPGSQLAPENTVTVIDMASLATTEVTVGLRPERVEFKPAESIAYVLNRGEEIITNRVTVLDVSDPLDPRVIATLETGETPIDVAFSDDGTKAVVTSVADRNITLIDAALHMPITTITGLAAPNDVVFLAGSHTALVADAGLEGTLALIDTETGALLPLGNVEIPMSAAAASPSGGRLYGLSFSHTDLVSVAADGSDYLGFLLASPQIAGTDIAPSLARNTLIYANSPSGPLVLAAGARGHLAAFEAESGIPRGHLDLATPLSSLAFSGISDRIVASLREDVVFADPKALWIGLRDPDGDCMPVTPPRDPKLVDVGYGIKGEIVVLVDDNKGFEDPYVPEEDSFAYVSRTWDWDGEFYRFERNECPGTVIARPRLKQVARKLYEKAPDVYDFLLIFYSSAWRDKTIEDHIDPVNTAPFFLDIQQTGAFAEHSWIRNYTRGIGIPRQGERVGSDASTYNATYLQSLIYLNDLGEYDGLSAGDPDSPVAVIPIMAHELAHRFGIFFNDPNERILETTTGRHWTRDFHSEASVIGESGNAFQYLEDNGDGTHDFLVTAVNSALGSWDLYLLGYRDPSIVPDSFLITNPERNDIPVGDYEGYQVGDIVTGGKIDVSFQNLIAPTPNGWGPRTPDSSLAQETFRLGLCLIVPAPEDGGSPKVRQGDLDEVRALVGALQDFWRGQTGSELLTESIPAYSPQYYTEKLFGIAVSDGVSPRGSDRLYLSGEGNLLYVLDDDENSFTFGQILNRIEGTEGRLLADPDGTRLYALSDRIDVIDVATEQIVQSYPLPAPASDAVIGSQGPAEKRAFVLLSDQTTIVIVDLETGLEVERFTPSPPSVHGLALTRDGEVLVYTSGIPGNAGITARGVASGEEIFLPARQEAFGAIDVFQGEANPNNTKERAETGDPPPALVYACVDARVVRVFEIVTHPAAQTFEFRELGVPDINFEVPSAADVFFAPEGSLALVQADPLCVATVEVARHRMWDNFCLDSGWSPEPPGHLFASADAKRIYLARSGLEEWMVSPGYSLASKALNNMGMACGQYDTAEGERHAFRWSIRYGLQDIHVLGEASSGEAINYMQTNGASGSVAGWFEISPAQTHAFLWTEKAGIADLGTLGTNPLASSAAFGINDLEQVVGWAENDSLARRAFLWTRSGGMIDLGSLGGASIAAKDVNHLGQVVGDGQDASGTVRAFVWTQGEGLRLILGAGGTRNGIELEVAAVNDRGEIAGRCATVAGDAFHAFLIRPLDTNGDGIPDTWSRDDNSDGRNDLLLDIGTLGGNEAVALSVNEASRVSGVSRDSSGYWQGFVWSEAGGMTELYNSDPGGTQIDSVVTNDRDQVAITMSWPPYYGAGAVFRSGRLLRIR